jgi:hypothetical protein
MAGNNINEILDLIYLKQIEFDLNSSNINIVVAVIFSFYYIGLNNKKIHKINNNHGAGMLIDFGNGRNFFVGKNNIFNSMNILFLNIPIMTIDDKFLKETNNCVIMKKCISTKKINIKCDMIFYKVIKTTNSFKIKYFKNKTFPRNFQFEQGMGFIGIDYKFLLIECGLSISCIS